MWIAYCGVMSAGSRPPRHRGHPTFVLAWVMLVVAGLAVVILVSRADGSAGAHGHLSVATQAFIGVSSFVLALTALGLIRRSSWALTAAAVEFGFGAVVCFVVLIRVARHPTGSAATDGSSYTALGAAIVGLLLLTCSFVLALPSARRKFRVSPAGWYPDSDSAAGGQWRWWDGETWSATTRPHG